jgi:hypothetical protein
MLHLIGAMCRECRQSTTFAPDGVRVSAASHRRNGLRAMLNLQTAAVHGGMNVSRSPWAAVLAVLPTPRVW